MKDDLAKALNGVLVLQQWQNQLVQSALRQIQAAGKKNPRGTGMSADYKESGKKHR
jgi:hypothetical protein